MYKGTLSSGVEIAVASTAVCESKEWTRAMEMAYRRKVSYTFKKTNQIKENHFELELLLYNILSLCRLMHFLGSTIRTL